MIDCSDRRLVLLDQTIFHCYWLTLRGLGDHLSHLWLPLLEVIDKLILPLDLELSLWSMLASLLFTCLLFIVSMRLDTLKLPVNDYESSFWVFTIIKCPLHLMIKQHWANLLLNRGILIWQFVLECVHLVIFLLFTASFHTFIWLFWNTSRLILLCYRWVLCILIMIWHWVKFQHWLLFTLE